MTSPFWSAPDWPWMAKLARAKVLTAELKSLIDDFVPTAYRLEYEPAGNGDTHLRIVEAKPVPAEIPTVIGDVVHNLRSSLDTIAYELARRSQGGQLTPEQERQPQFPMFDNPTSYDNFFQKSTKGVFDAKAEEALRSVAPGWMFDPLAIVDGQLALTFEQAIAIDQLWPLHQLSIIDKHRRLHLVAWWPDDVWWVNREGNGPGWRWGTRPFTQGRILGTFVGDNAPDREDLTATLELRIEEPQAARAALPVVETLNRTLNYIWHAVLPRVWHGY